MPEYKAVVEQWLAMSHPDLTDHIRRFVRGGSRPSPVWTAVGAHPVLTARVRGILSALHAQMADHRDHAMWTLWINNARCALTTPSPAHARSETPPRADAQPPTRLTASTTTPAATPRHRPSTITPVTFLAPGQTTTNPAAT